MQKFSTYLRQLRKEARLTQEELAQTLGVSNTYIHQLETGKIDAPTEERARQLAEILGVSPGELWDLARKERLLRFARREGIDTEEGLAEVTEAQTRSALEKHEIALINLIRGLDRQTLRHFNDTVYMLLRYSPEKRIQRMLREYIDTTKVA